MKPYKIIKSILPLPQKKKLVGILKKTSAPLVFFKTNKPIPKKNVFFMEPEFVHQPNSSCDQTNP